MKSDNARYGFYSNMPTKSDPKRKNYGKQSCAARTFHLFQKQPYGEACPYCRDAKTLD